MMNSHSTIDRGRAPRLCGSLAATALVAAGLIAPAHAASPADAYGVVDALHQDLSALVEARGVTAPAPADEAAAALTPAQLYQRSRLVVAKVARQRKVYGLPELPEPEARGAQITPQAVADTAQLARSGLESFLERAALAPASLPDPDPTKRPADVYRLLGRCSAKLDALLGGYGFTPGDVLGVARANNARISALLAARGVSEPSEPERSWKMRRPAEIYAQGREVLLEVEAAIVLAGGKPVDTELPAGPVAPGAVYELNLLLHAELARLGTLLEAPADEAAPRRVPGATSTQVYRTLQSQQVLADALKRSFLDPPAPSDEGGAP